MRVPSSTVEKMSVEENRRGNALTVAPIFAQFVESELLPAIGIDPDRFWSGLESIIDDLTPLNRSLLEKRAEIQSRLNAWHAEREGGCHCGRDADAQAGEQARSDVDGDHADLAQLDPRLLADEVDLGCEHLRVALAARRVRRRQHAFMPTDGTADLGGGALDPEDQHGGDSRHGATASATARLRAIHRAPTQCSSMVRSSSSSP